MLEDLFPCVTYYVTKSCDAAWRLQKTKMVVCDLTFLLDGQATYWVDGVKLELKKGDAVFIHQGRFREAGNASMRCAAFNFVYQSSSKLVLPPKIRWQENDHLGFLLEEYRRENVLREVCWEAKSRALFLEIICETVRCAQSSLHSPLVRKMQRFILSHLFEPVTVRQIAAQFGRHPNYCGAVFRAEQGCTIQEYVHRLRLEHAVGLMKEGDLSIGEIALQSGYHDIYYFSRVFKRFKGVSPSAYAEGFRKLD